MSNLNIKVYYKYINLHKFRFLFFFLSIFRNLKGIQETYKIKLPISLNKIFEHEEILDFIDYRRKWLTFSKIFRFKIKRLDESLLNLEADFQLYFPNSKKFNNEFFGSFQFFLLYGISFHYRISLVSRKQKAIIDPTKTHYKTIMKILIAFDYNKSFRFLNHEKDFLEFIANVIYAYLFSPFIPHKKIQDVVEIVEVKEEENEA